MAITSVRREGLRPVKLERAPPGVIWASVCRRARVLLLLLPGLSACAVNNTGFLAARVTDAEGAVVVDSYSLGGHLRTGGHDRGIAAGVGRRSYVFATVSGASEVEDVATGWHLFHWRRPAGDVVASDVMQIGLDLELGQSLSFLAGLGRTTQIARVSADSTVALYLKYAPRSPTETVSIYCKEKEECWEDILKSRP